MNGHKRGKKFLPHKKTHGISVRDIESPMPMKGGKIDIEKILRGYVPIKRDFPEEPDDKPFG